MPVQQNKTIIEKKTHHTSGRPKRMQPLLRFFCHLLLSCGIIWLLLGMMFLMAKGPAYIFFEENPAQNSLSELHSQDIRLCADTVMADIADGSHINTQVFGTTIALSATALSEWMGDILQEDVHPNAYLLLEGNSAWGLGIQHSSAGDTARYRIQDAYNTTIRPLVSPSISGTVEELQIFPSVGEGNAFTSFLLRKEPLSFILPNDNSVQAYIVYRDHQHNKLRVPITVDMLPNYQALDDDVVSFTVTDSAIMLRSPEKGPLQMQVKGRYALKLSCIGVERIQGYLAGTLLFQNTNSQKNYTLAGQLVEIASKDHGLSMILCRDLRTEPQASNTLSISGEATQMDISGIDPFPNLRMWFRENLYIAPVSLLSIVISTVGLTLVQKPHKVKVRRKRS